MEVVLCDKHGKPCFLKTGTKEGASKGHSFYICSQSKNEPCKYSKPTNLPVSFCLQHENEMVDLQALAPCKNAGKTRRFYRCKKGHALSGGSWCGYVYADDLKLSDISKNSEKGTNGSKEDDHVTRTNKGTSPNIVAQSHETHDKNPQNSHPKSKNGSRQMRKATEKSHPIETAQTEVTHSKDAQNNSGEPPSVIKPKTVYLNKKTGSLNIQNTTARKTNEQLTKPKEDDEFISCIFPPEKKTGKNVKTGGNKEANTFSMDSLMDSLPNTDNGSKQLKSKGSTIQSDIAQKNNGDDKSKKMTPSTDSHIASSSASSTSFIDTQVAIPSQSDQALRSEVSLKLEKQKTLLKTVPLALLSDKGVKLKNNIKMLEETLKEIDDKIARGVPVQKPGSSGALKQITLMESFKRQQPKVAMVDAMSMPAPGQPYQYTDAPQVQTLYGGRMTSARLREVGSVTRDAIDRLHRSLETCPAADEETTDPKKLTVPLLTHQRQGLTWLIWRESQHPCGGILADDMGLGKTLTMISLILKQRELSKGKPDETDSDSGDFIKSSASLIICPASLLHQWKNEIDTRCKRGVLHTYLYHGPNREKSVSVLAGYDIVLTTYGIIGKELGTGDVNDEPNQPVSEWMSKENPEKAVTQPTLLKIGWQRIILDEAHNIKNHKCQSAVGVCRLRACARWAVTGTPIQNNLLDMFSLLRFLRCSPFDEYKVWKRQVDSNQKRLNTLTKSLLLRRTKDQKNKDGKALVSLPERTCTTHEIDLSDDERKMYTKLFEESKSKISNYLEQHGESTTSTDGGKVASQANSSIGSMADKPSTGPDKVTGTVILVILLRLRQCCSHLGLLKESITEEHFEFDNSIEMSLVDQMMDLSLGGSQTKDKAEQKKSDRLDETYESTKVKEVLRNLIDIRKRSPKVQPMKSVIVSQWTKMLDIVAHHLTEEGFKYSSIRGSVSAKKRAELVEDFNTNDKGAEVMLVSLRAGGVGLNLIGGNHLFILDMHWNPALEQQACDRIYRVGQKKDVFIHKFVCKDTIEEKILKLQKSKALLAENVLTGNKSKNQKLTLQDLRLLFGVH